VIFGRRPLRWRVSHQKENLVKRSLDHIPARRGARTSVVIAALALALGFGLGSQSNGPSALAQGAERSTLEERLALIELRLREKDLVPIIVQPPAVGSSKDGFAVVGGADGRYYVVRSDGASEEVVLDRRTDLFWRYELHDQR
jgi:hypothetical protein